LLDQVEVHRARKRGASASVVKPILRFLDVEEAGHHVGDLIGILAYAAKEAKLLPSSSVALREMLEEDWAYAMACFDTWLLAYNATLEDLSPDEETEAWRALRLRYDTAIRMADGAKERVAKRSMKEVEGWIESQGIALVIL
jgi:hypothetical protein